MTHRYPEDVNDPTGTNVETNNARLVDDEGNRVLPAVRVPQDSDPCCAEVINAPAKQLRDRLALLESKVPLLDEAAAVNDGSLALLGNVIVGGQVVETLTPEDFSGGEGISPKMAELVGPPNLDEPIVLTYEGVEYVADGVYFRREGEGTFAMIDDSKLAWLEINNSAYARPASDVLLAYKSATSVIDTEKIITTKIETKDISAQNANINDTLVATEIRTDSVEVGENVTAGGTVTAQKFVGQGVLKGLGFVGLFIASGGGTTSINGSLYSSWNIQHVSNNKFSVSGVTQSCTAVLIQIREASETDYESVLMANGISSVSVSSNGEFLLPMTDAKYLVFIV